MGVTIGEKLRHWSGRRVSVVFANDEIQVGELNEVGDDFLVLQVGSIQYVISMHSVVRVNEVQAGERPE